MTATFIIKNKEMDSQEIILEMSLSRPRSRHQDSMSKRRKLLRGVVFKREVIKTVFQERGLLPGRTPLACSHCSSGEVHIFVRKDRYLI